MATLIPRGSESFRVNSEATITYDSKFSPFSRCHRKARHRHREVSAIVDRGIWAQNLSPRTPSRGFTKSNAFTRDHPRVPDSHTATCTIRAILCRALGKLSFPVVSASRLPREPSRRWYWLVAPEIPPLGDLSPSMGGVMLGMLTQLSHFVPRRMRGSQT